MSLIGITIGSHRTMSRAVQRCPHIIAHSEAGRRLSSTAVGVVSFELPTETERGRERERESYPGRTNFAGQKTRVRNLRHQSLHLRADTN